MPPRRTGVLLVDDEPRELDIMRNVLESAGFQVWTANGYDVARAIFMEQHEAIDVLVTDVSMPGRTGIELASDLLNIKSGLKILFVSGYVGAQVIRSYGLTITDLQFLSKPFVPKKLIERVNLLLGITEGESRTQASGPACD